MTAIIIFGSALIVYLLGLPLVNAIHKEKEHNDRI